MAVRGLASFRTRAIAGVVGIAIVALVAADSPAATLQGPSLGAARTFAALAGSTVTSTGLSQLVGDVGVSPGTAIVGFPPATVTGGSIESATLRASQAHGDAALAYAYLKGMASLPADNRSNVDLGGLTLGPGVYKFDADAQLTGDLVLDAGGAGDALFVFQIGSSLTTASGATVRVINGGASYDTSNVFWQVGSSATLGSGTSFTGNILAYASITLVSGTTLDGSALALVGAVTMDAATITSPPLPAPPVSEPGSPAAPLVVAAVPNGTGMDHGVVLSWIDRSDNETEFRVFRRDGAAPDFVLIATVPTIDSSGTGTVMTFTDRLLDPSPTYSYRVSAFSTADGESVASDDLRVDARAVPMAGDPGPSRWLEVHVGGARSVLLDRPRAGRDHVRLNGSYSVIVVDNGIPTVLDAADPRATDTAIQIRAPGGVLFVAIAADDPAWRERREGVYTWRTHDGRGAPVSRIRIDTRRSTFRFRSTRAELGPVTGRTITVSLAIQGAAGSDTRVWESVTGRSPLARTRHTLAKWAD